MQHERQLILAMALFNHKDHLGQFPASPPYMRAHPAKAPLPVPQAAGTAETLLLKRYRPLQTRAAGGFGTVEICLDSRLQRRVAIKRIPLSHATSGQGPSAQTTAAALAEARTASLLQHPNIVAVHDFTYDAAYAYLVMEYVDGMSLEEFLAQVEGNSLTFDEVACVADALAQALSFAHENRVLHLDIKPANVLIDRSGHVKLTDFGMASLASAGGFGGARGGTIGYMSPEQLDGREVDERTDLFALAAVLYECLCGQAPFRAATPADSLALIEQPITPPSELLPDMPPASEAILLEAMTGDIENRTASALDFAECFCAGLGDIRAGSRSLERIIARLTSDEVDPEADSTAPQETPEQILNPAEGHLGTHMPQARTLMRGIICGLSSAFVTSAYDAATSMFAQTSTADFGLATLPGISKPVWGLAALCLGAAGAFAPQLGSALVAILACLSLFSASSLSTIPTVVLIAAITVGWWLTWGHSHPGAGACYTALLAVSLATGSPTVAAPLVIAYLAFDTPSATAATTAALGILTGACVLAASQTEGGLPLSQALSTLVNPSFLVQLLGFSAFAAVEGILLKRSWARRQENNSTGLYVLAFALPLCVVVLLSCLANPMEIASSSSLLLPLAMARGAASSIIVWLCTYLLGYRKDSTAGDCS